MKQLFIDGVIGWDVIPAQFRKNLDEANGEELEIKIASPGGFVYDGLEIFNSIRDYTRNKNKVTVILSGLAASMASYIAMAGTKIKSEDNAVFMIHNVKTIAWGDAEDLRKEADQVESLTGLLSKAYADKTGKSIKEIRKMMEEESFFYGEEILSAGFVDEIIKVESTEKDKVNQITMAKARITACQKSMEKSDKQKDDFKKAVAFLNIEKPENKIEEKSKDEEIKASKNIQGVKMDLKELQLNHSELFNQVVNIGVNQERERVKAHIILGKQSKATEKMLDYIEKGNSVSEQSVIAEYMSAGMKNNAIQARLEDNVIPPAGTTENDQDKSVITDADTKKYTDELIRLRGGKK